MGVCSECESGSSVAARTRNGRINEGTGRVLKEATLFFSRVRVPQLCPSVTGCSCACYTEVRCYAARDS